MYQASSGNPRECRDEDVADETQTTKSKLKPYLFQFEKTKFGLNR
jgi:hypothetical protein